VRTDSVALLRLPRFAVISAALLCASAPVNSMSNPSVPALDCSALKLTCTLPEPTLLSRASSVCTRLASAAPSAV
jgi:hypothetical protein